MKTREELIVEEIDRRTGEFLKELKLDAAKKIAEHINTIDISVQELVAARAIAKLNEIQEILYDYYRNTDNKYNNKYAETMTLERINKVLNIKRI